MPSRVESKYSTRELSIRTWPDFEKLFLKQGVVVDAWWCWCTFHHVTSFSLPENAQPRTRAERAVRNRQRKKELVEKSCAHGIIVYAGKEPVGWTQFGSSDELPRMDNTKNYRKLELDNSAEKLCRITCFVVDKAYRGRGVTGAGLRAALEAIRKNGGGLVEAYPVSKTDQGSNYIYCGTVSIFEKAGFKTIAPLATGRTATVVMQRRI
jgi:ribosomal protein S18 acetylase RimI-like enzyme